MKRLVSVQGVGSCVGLDRIVGYIQAYRCQYKQAEKELGRAKIRDD